MEPPRQAKIVLFVLVGCICLTSSISPGNESGGWRQWHWNCVESRCTRTDGAGTTLSQQSPAACRLTCGHHGSLWPRPTGPVTLVNELAVFNPSGVRFDFSGIPPKAREFTQEVATIFSSNLMKECGRNCTLESENVLVILLNARSEDMTLTWATDEGYNLELKKSGNQMTATISAPTVFGVRHGLETLSQLTASHGTSSRQALVAPYTAKVHDRPAYPHRGLMMDTARNYVTVKAIKRTLDGMAASKMNVFHWHLTDTQSFPFVSTRVPQLSRFGAYSPSQVYRPQEIQHLLHYALVRGIRIILEIDAPAHAGAGWQWGSAAGLGDLVACWKHSPWRERCIQPPCGQLNPANSNLYRVLADLYRDIVEALPIGEVFHMGGDEVFFPCWNATKDITDLMDTRGMGREKADFLRLWAEYQATALRVFDEASSSVTPGAIKSLPPIILWSSHMTDPVVIEGFLPKDRYVIQTWVIAEDPLPSQLLELGYKVILSTKDAWYLDHGFWGNTQYHSWRTAYENKLPRFKALLGGEACMWTEYVDDQNLDARIWPRTAAVAERLWADPAAGSRYAEGRLARHRERLITRGIKPETLQPLWCYQNEGECA